MASNLWQTMCMGCRYIRSQGLQSLPERKVAKRKGVKKERLRTDSQVKSGPDQRALFRGPTMIIHRTLYVENALPLSVVQLHCAACLCDS